MKVYIEGEGSWRSEFQKIVNDSKVEIVENDTAKKEECKFIVYAVTPKMKVLESVIDVINDSNVRIGRTIFCALYEEDGDEFTPHQKKSLIATGKMVETNGGKFFESLQDVANYILGINN